VLTIILWSSIAVEDESKLENMKLINAQVILLDLMYIYE